MAETLLRPVNRRNLIVKSVQNYLFYTFSGISFFPENASDYFKTGSFSEEAIEWEVLTGGTLMLEEVLLKYFRDFL